MGSDFDQEVFALQQKATLALRAHDAGTALLSTDERAFYLAVSPACVDYLMARLMEATGE